MKKEKEDSIIERVKYYSGLPYTIQLIKNEDGTYFGSIKELPGCMTEGDTLEEALEMLEDAKSAWLEIAIEDGDKIPFPESFIVKNYSGRFNVRIPKSLHRRLAEGAESDNVSLNVLVTNLLESGSTLKQLIREKDETIKYLSIQNYKLTKENMELKQSEYPLQKGMVNLSNGDIANIFSKGLVVYHPMN